jgi:hypothetical protein
MAGRNTCSSTGSASSGRTNTDIFVIHHCIIVKKERKRRLSDESMAYAAGVPDMLHTGLARAESATADY